MSPRPIGIVGTGLAGLALGRCLKQHGVSTILLEKMSSRPRKTYGITLQPWAFRPLLRILQIDESAFREEVSTDFAQRKIRETPSSTLAPGVDTSHGAFRCDHRRLWRLLREGLDIRLKHFVRSVEILSQGHIGLHVKDKQPVETEVLIGTDGMRSRVRRSFMPENRLKTLPFVAFNCRRCLSIAEFEETVAPALQGLTSTYLRHKDIILEISINEFTDEKEVPKNVQISYVYSRPPREDGPLDRRLLGIIDPRTPVPEEFYTELGELKQLPQPFDTIFDPAMVRKDDVTPWRMLSTLGDPTELKNLAEQGILLVGDSIHPMRILGGEGASFAIKDGVDLAEYIVRHGTQNLQGFIDERYEAWKTGMEESEKRLAEMYGLRDSSLWLPVTSPGAAHLTGTAAGKISEIDMSH